MAIHDGVTWRILIQQKNTATLPPSIDSYDRRKSMTCANGHHRPPCDSFTLTVSRARCEDCMPSHLTNAEIARECLMSVNTVKAHLKNIYAKLGVSTRAQTVERARLLGLP